jgi:hypothetical protein
VVEVLIILRTRLEPFRQHTHQLQRDGTVRAHRVFEVVLSQHEQVNVLEREHCR